MSQEELKQMIVGILYDDAIAIQCQTLGQYRDAIMEKVIDIDVKHEFKTDAEMTEPQLKELKKSLKECIGQSRDGCSN